MKGWCAVGQIGWWRGALTPGPSPIGRGGNFGIDVGCGWLGMVCGMDFRSFGFAQDDMVCIWGALTPGPSSYRRGGMFGYCVLVVGAGYPGWEGGGVSGVALTPGPSPIGRGGNFGIDVGCGWLGMVCRINFRSFGFAQDDMVWWVTGLALTPGPSSYGRGGMFGYCLLMVGAGYPGWEGGGVKGMRVFERGLSIVGGNSSGPFVVSLENHSGRPFDRLRANGGRDCTRIIERSWVNRRRAPRAGRQG